jgi:hypothetical protein
MKDQGAFLSELSLMLGELSADINFCETGMQDSRSQWRRLYVRSVFAAIEGFAFFLKQHTLNRRMIDCYDSFKKGTPDLPLRDLALLFEESYTLKDNGEPQTTNAKLRTLPNLLFALSSFAQSVGSKWQIRKDAGFAALTNAVRIRDRLTHPKTLDALTVTDKELDAVKQAFGWVRREFTRIVQETPGATITAGGPPNKPSQRIAHPRRVRKR